MTQETVNKLTMLLPLLVQVVGMVAAVLVDSFLSRKQKRTFLLIAVLVFSLIAENYAEMYLALGKPRILARTLVSIYGYSVRPVILVLFLRVVGPGRRLTPSWVLAGINAVVYLTALFSPVAFYFDEDYRYHSGPLKYYCLLTSLALLGNLVCLTIREYYRLNRRRILIPLFNVLLIIGGILLDDNVGYYIQWVTFLTIAIVCSSSSYYIWLHLEFAREHERALLAEQRIQILMAQIKPHFIYNSLTAIRSYLDEPDKAEEVLNHFAGFLRSSIDVLDEAGSISAEKEFATVNSYLYLERERFGEKLTVETDLQDLDYRLPAFTVQALVENAVKHGVRKNPSGRGKVSIRSYQTEQEHIIEVADDGPGFLAEETDLEGTHVGLANIRQRLALMCDGILEIESAPGRGTLARVRIPKDTSRMLGGYRAKKEKTKRKKT